MAGVNPDLREVARQWAIATCKAQGLDVKVAAAGVVALVAVQLTAGKQKGATASKPD